MNIFKKIYCRTFQTVFHIALPILPYRTPKIIDQVTDLPAVLKKHGISRVLIVTDSGICRVGLLTPLTEALTGGDISYEVYNRTVANPTTVNIAEAVEQYRQGGCQGLIAIGGGSSMDCAKAAGACINDVIIHLATSEMGFGEFGESGMGTYHGKVGFETFSHFKSIVDKKTWMDLPMRYQPYQKIYDKLIHMFLR